MITLGEEIQEALQKINELIGVCDFSKPSSHLAVQTLSILSAKEFKNEPRELLALKDLSETVANIWEDMVISYRGQKEPTQ